MFMNKDALWFDAGFTRQGVWEEASAGNFTEDLQDIAGQLLRLRELLTVRVFGGLHGFVRDALCKLQVNTVDLRGGLGLLEDKGCMGVIVCFVLRAIASVAWKKRTGDCVKATKNTR